MTQWGTALDPVARSVDYGPLALVVEALRPEIVADVVAQLKDGLLAEFRTMLGNLPAPVTHVAPPAVSVTVDAAEAPETITAEFPGFEKLTGSLDRIEKLLTKLVQVSQQPLSTQVIRGAGGLIESTTQRRG